MILIAAYIAVFLKTELVSRTKGHIFDELRTLLDVFRVIHTSFWWCLEHRVFPASSRTSQKARQASVRATKQYFSPWMGAYHLEI